MVEVRKFADWSICIRKILYPYMFSSFDPVCEQEDFFSSSFYVRKWSEYKQQMTKKNNKIKCRILSSGMHLYNLEVEKEEATMKCF
jgi:hypothetical protein